MPLNPRPDEDPSTAPGIPLLVLPKSIWHPMCLESISEVPRPIKSKGRMTGAPYFGTEI